jgi:hypothetical protein
MLGGCHLGGGRTRRLKLEPEPLYAGRACNRSDASPIATPNLLLTYIEQLIVKNNHPLYAFQAFHDTNIVSTVIAYFYNASSN